MSLAVLLSHRSGRGTWQLLAACPCLLCSEELSAGGKYGHFAPPALFQIICDSPWVTFLCCENRPFTPVLPFLPATTDLASRSFLSPSHTALYPQEPVVEGLAVHPAGHPSRPHEPGFLPCIPAGCPCDPSWARAGPRAWQRHLKLNGVEAGGYLPSRSGEET